MARPLRLPLPGGIYHVTARGNDRQAIFEGEADCSLFTRYRVRCHAYCLMGNHYHLLLETPEGNLSAAMRQLNGVYTQRFNRRYERCGHVLQGRFGAQLVDGQAYLHEVCRYIVLNPVRAALSSHPRDWRWSSFRAPAPSRPICDSWRRLSARAMTRSIASVRSPSLPTRSSRAAWMSTAAPWRSAPRSHAPSVSPQDPRSPSSSTA